MNSINPYNNEVVKEYEEYSMGKINNIIDLTHGEFLNWRKVELRKRCDLLLSVKAKLLESKEDLAI